MSPSPRPGTHQPPCHVSFAPGRRRRAGAHLSEEADDADGAEGEDEGDGEADGGEADEGEADDGQVQQAPAVAEEFLGPGVVDKDSEIVHFLSPAKGGRGKEGEMQRFSPHRKGTGTSAARPAAACPACWWPCIRRAFKNL